MEIYRLTHPRRGTLTDSRSVLQPGRGPGRKSSPRKISQMSPTNPEPEGCNDLTASVAERTAVNRRLLADFFDSLDDAQLDSASPCQAWTVREVLAHLAMPMAVGIRRLLVQAARRSAPVVSLTGD